MTPCVVERSAQAVLRLLEARGLAHVEQELRDAASSEAAPEQAWRGTRTGRVVSAIKAIVTRTFLTPWSIGPAAKPAARKASAAPPVRPIGLNTRRATGVAARYRMTRIANDGGDERRGGDVGGGVHRAADGRPVRDENEHSSRSFEQAGCGSNMSDQRGSRRRRARSRSRRSGGRRGSAAGPWDRRGRDGRTPPARATGPQGRSSRRRRRWRSRAGRATR